jgi:hypothetical protein
VFCCLEKPVTTEQLDDVFSQLGRQQDATPGANIASDIPPLLEGSLEDLIASVKAQGLV